MGSMDEKFMRRALFLAESRTKDVSPNPRVGAVLVMSGKIVGEGATQPYGGAHAEIIALRKAGPRAQGATLYVTLEPCSHHGKTPPCSEAIIAAGVRRVVAAMKDPFPKVRGKGFSLLKRAGIKVGVGLLKKEAGELNPAFFFAVTHGRPWVLLKVALSMDGKIAGKGGKPLWITGEKARRRVHEMRSRMDAILVGRGTAQKDDPALTVRLPGHRRDDGWPLRVLLDSNLRVPPKAQIFQGAAKTVVFTSRKAPVRREENLRQKGILVFRVPLQEKMLSLKAVLKVLHSLQVRSLMVEGGGRVQGTFLKEGLVDEVALLLSPKILGKDALPWRGDGGIENLRRLSFLKQTRMESVGEDLLLTGKWKG